MSSIIENEALISLTKMEARSYDGYGTLLCIGTVFRPTMFYRERERGGSDFRINTRDRVCQKSLRNETFSTKFVISVILF